MGTKHHGARSIAAPTGAIGPWAPDLEHTLRGLSPVAGAPPRPERARERGVEEIDRRGVVGHLPHTRGRHCPQVGAANIVEPGRHLGVPVAEPLRRDADADADGKRRSAAVIKLRGLANSRTPVRDEFKGFWARPRLPLSRDAENLQQA
jgi:hypothetical protein